jgi:uncharacterized protein with GYD domain
MNAGEVENLSLIAQHMNAITPIDWEAITAEYGLTLNTVYKTVATDVVGIVNNMPQDEATMTLLMAILTQVMVKNVVLETMAEDYQNHRSIFGEE